MCAIGIIDINFRSVKPSCISSHTWDRYATRGRIYRRFLHTWHKSQPDYMRVCTHASQPDYMRDCTGIMRHAMQDRRISHKTPENFQQISYSHICICEFKNGCRHIFIPVYANSRMQRMQPYKFTLNTPNAFHSLEISSVLSIDSL